MTESSNVKSRLGELVLDSVIPAHSHALANKAEGVRTVVRTCIIALLGLLSLAQVDEMLQRLYEPILWRALTAPNPHGLLPSNASLPSLFFPLLPPYLLLDHNTRSRSPLPTISVRSALDVPRPFLPPSPLSVRAGAAAMLSAAFPLLAPDADREATDTAMQRHFDALAVRPPSLLPSPFPLTSLREGRRMQRKHRNCK